MALSEGLPQARSRELPPPLQRLDARSSRLGHILDAQRYAPSPSRP